MLPDQLVGEHSLGGPSSGCLILAVMLLAFVVMKPPGQLGMRWRPANLWQRVIRFRLVLAVAGKISRSRLRRRLDLLLVQMLDGHADHRHPPSRS